MAADKGTAVAMSALARIYRKGSPESSTGYVKKDLALADEWLRRAKAASSDTMDAVNQGRMQEEERGIHAGMAGEDAEDAAKIEAERARVQVQIDATMGEGIAAGKARLHTMLSDAANPASRSGSKNLECFRQVGRVIPLRACAQVQWLCVLVHVGYPHRTSCPAASVQGALVRGMFAHTHAHRMPTSRRCHYF